MKRLRKGNVTALLADLGQEKRVLCPQRLPNGDMVYAEPGIGSIALTGGKPLISVKAFLLPQIEPIIGFGKDSVSIFTEAERTVLFGIAPCEMRAIEFITRFMTRDGLADPQFVTKRQSLATVVVACTQPKDEYCFCVDAGGKPFADSGFDLQMFDVGDSYLVESGSTIGESILAEDAFDEPEPEDQERLETLKAKAVERQSLAPGMARAIELLRKEDIDEEFWEELARYCINCGSCVYVCPTCTCFYVEDLPCSGGYTRFRSWDACLHEGFSRETSGHNPRPTPGSRLARRHEHKLKFDVMNFHESGCVGCGRCSIVCPVGLGAIEVISRINGAFASADTG